MEPVAISWLVASATSPLIAVLALWTVYVFHTYRQRWRSVDLFLLAVAAQELISAIFSFGYAIISLINPPVNGLCSFIQWGLISIRALQMATLTSMVVDRALTVRWPYRYRFSIRRNQIRYHVAVLALMAILVGVASVFAHLPNSGTDRFLCSAHPSRWDFKFVVFLLGFYGVLLLVSLACTVQVEIYKCRNRARHPANGGRPFQLPDGSSSELPVPTSVMSPLDNDSHTGSTRALHRPNRQCSRRPYNMKSNTNSDFRWPPVAVVSLVCLSINHLPYLVLTAAATAVPWLWTPWHESLLCWLRLAEGVLVPIVLYTADQPLRLALKRTFQRRSGALSPLVGDDCPFQMYFSKDNFRKRETFGSITPIGIIANYRRTPGKKLKKECKSKYKLPGLNSGDSVIEKSCLAGSFMNTEPLSKLSCADLSSLEVWQEEDDKDDKDFYATLSDDYTSVDESSMFNNDAKMSDEVYGGSFTTIANDDFEFHDTRPCGGEVRMRPSLPDDEPAPLNNSFRYCRKSESLDNPENTEKLSSLSKPTLTEQLRELMNITEQSDEDRTKEDPDILSQTELTVDISPSDKFFNESDQTPSSLGKATSFSMNDLALICSDDGEIEEKVYLLPTKSESTMSLYRLRLDKEMSQLLPVAKSENNINTDSGFGSGSQTMRNPIWPAYQIRKGSDPFHNLKKPAVSPPPPMMVTNKLYPCILHPRMLRIPWISAWKKLGGKNDNHPGNKKNSQPSSTSKDSSRIIRDNFELRQKEDFRWKDSMIYGQEALVDSCPEPHMENMGMMSNVPESVFGISHRSPVFPCSPQHLPNDKTFLSDGIYSKMKMASFSENSRGKQNNDQAYYGKLLDNHARYMEDMEAAASTRDNNCRGQENIYEEIIGNNRHKNIEESVRKNSTAHEVSYAVSGLLDVDNNREIPSKGEGNHFINECVTLNINVEPHELEEEEHFQQTNYPAYSSDQSKYAVISKIDVGYSTNTSYDMAINQHVNQNSPSHFGYNNRVHVPYNLNDGCSEFAESSAQNRDNSLVTFYSGNHRDISYDKSREFTDIQQPENPNDGITKNFGRNPMRNDDGTMNESVRVCGVKRRKSKSSRNKSYKSNSMNASGSDNEMPNFKRDDNFAIIRRDSSNRSKSRSIKQRENGSRTRNSHLNRRESSNSRARKAQSETEIYGSPRRTTNSGCFQPKESFGSLWPSEPPRKLYVSSSSNGNDFPSVDHREDNFEYNVGDTNSIDEGEILKLLHGEHQDSIASRIQHQQRDFVREVLLKSPDYNQNEETGLKEKDQVGMNYKSSDVQRILISNQYSFDKEPTDHLLQLKGSAVEGQRSNEYSKDDSIKPRQDRRECRNNNRNNYSRVVLRSGSKNGNRPHQESVTDTSSADSKPKRHSQLMKDGKRRTSLEDGNKFLINMNSNFRPLDISQDFNSNNPTEKGSSTEEHFKITNPLYDHKDNGNYGLDSKHFESFGKPPSYDNVIKHHFASRSNSDPKDRYRQKKIAVTDYL